MLKMLLSKPWQIVGDNDVDSLIPEVWANESLIVLYENSIMAQLVHRDFENEIAEFGDIVNTRQPAKFVGERKTDDEDVTDQDAKAPNVPVPLNQHWHISFIIKDGQESKSFLRLRELFLEPALEAAAKSIDEMILGERYNFLANAVGTLGSPVTKKDVISAQVKLDDNNAPQRNRWAVWTPRSQGDLLDLVEFTHADVIGDDGTALREGAMGRKFGFNHVMSQNNKTIKATVQEIGAINNGPGYIVGNTVLTVDGFSAAIATGSWLTIAGDNIPQLVTATVGGATPTQVTITPGLSADVADDAAVTVYEAGLVNQSVVPTGYPVNHVKRVTFDGGIAAPVPGQLISFGATDGQRYGRMTMREGASTTDVLLNRQLDAAVADDAVMGTGPSGNFNFSFHRNCISLVTRPLASPMSGTGAVSAVVSMDGIGVRVVISYDAKAQGHRVTVDLLAGVKTLDTDLGVPVLG